MRLLDILLLILLVWGGYRGFKKGLVLELFSFSALVLATLGSTSMLDNALELYTQWYHDSNEVLYYIVFVLLFVSILVAITWVGKFFKALIKSTLLGGLDRLLGSLVGLLKWGICSSACLWLGGLLQLKLPETYTANTFIFPVIQSIAPQLLTWCSIWWPHLQEYLPTYESTSI